MKCLPPVENAESEDSATLEIILVRRITVQLTVTESSDLIGGDPIAEAELVRTVREALAE